MNFDKSFTNLLEVLNHTDTTIKVEQLELNSGVILTAELSGGGGWEIDLNGDGKFGLRRFDV